MHEAGKQQARPLHQYSDDEDAPSAVPIEPWAQERHDHSGDADLESADQRKCAARNAQLLCDRFEKNAQRARKGKCPGDVDQNSDPDDVPTIEESPPFRL
jgi:hypothetical protein